MYTERKKERRSFGGKTSFPLRTKGGYRVEKDRRRIPDRRLGNIHLELVDTVDYGFSDSIASTPFYASEKKDC